MRGAMQASGRAVVGDVIQPPRGGGRGHTRRRPEAGTAREDPVRGLIVGPLELHRRVVGEWDEGEPETKTRSGCRLAALAGPGE